MNFKQLLERKFESEEAIGVYFEDAKTGLREEEFKARFPDKEFEGISLLPNGKNFFICGNSAELVLETLGEGKIYGFYSENNPSATHPEIVGAGGHDFAVIRNRYIVDLWISHYTGSEKQHVFDMWDKKDHKLITEIFGDVRKWTAYEHAISKNLSYEELPKENQPKLRNVVQEAECSPT